MIVVLLPTSLLLSHLYVIDACLLQIKVYSEVVVLYSFGNIIVKVNSEWEYHYSLPMVSAYWCLLLLLEESEKWKRQLWFLEVSIISYLHLSSPLYLQTRKGMSYLVLKWHYYSFSIRSNRTCMMYLILMSNNLKLLLQYVVETQFVTICPALNMGGRCKY